MNRNIASCLPGLFAGGIEIISGKRRGATGCMGMGSMVEPAFIFIFLNKRKGDLR